MISLTLDQGSMLDVTMISTVNPKEYQNSPNREKGFKGFLS
jgi:hypothetical protein